MLSCNQICFMKVLQVLHLTLVKCSTVRSFGFCSQSNVACFLLLANSEHSSSNQGFFLCVSKIPIFSFAHALILSRILTQVSSTLEISKSSKVEHYYQRLSDIPLWFHDQVVYLSCIYLLQNVALFPSLMTVSRLVATTM